VVKRPQHSLTLVFQYQLHDQVFDLFSFTTDLLRCVQIAGIYIPSRSRRASIGLWTKHFLEGWNTYFAYLDRLVSATIWSLLLPRKISVSHSRSVSLWTLAKLCSCWSKHKLIVDTLSDVALDNVSARNIVICCIRAFTIILYRAYVELLFLTLLEVGKL